MFLSIKVCPGEAEAGVGGALAVDPTLALAERQPGALHPCPAECASSRKRGLFQPPRLQAPPCRADKGLAGGSSGLWSLGVLPGSRCLSKARGGSGGGAGGRGAEGAVRAIRCEHPRARCGRASPRRGVLPHTDFRITGVSGEF